MGLRDGLVPILIMSEPAGDESYLEYVSVFRLREKSRIQVLAILAEWSYFMLTV